MNVAERHILVVEPDDELWQTLLKRTRLILPEVRIDRACNDAELAAWKVKHKGMVLYGAVGVAELHEAVISGANYEISILHTELSRVYQNLKNNTEATAAIAMAVEGIEKILHEMSTEIPAIKETINDSNAKLTKLDETVYGNGEPGLVQDAAEAKRDLKEAKDNIQDFKAKISLIESRAWKLVSIPAGLLLAGLAGAFIKAMWDKVFGGGS